MNKKLRMVLWFPLLVTVCLPPAAPAGEGDLITTVRPLTEDEIAIGYGEKDLPMWFSYEEKKMYYPRHWSDIPATDLLGVDPATTPYPIIMEDSWKIYLGYRVFSPEECLEDAKKGNVGAMIHRYGYDHLSLWPRLVDKLTRQGWFYGVIGNYQKGALLGDGYSLFEVQPGRGLNNRAALQGYPEAMAMIPFSRDNYEECTHHKLWLQEGSLRGYEYGWSLIAPDFIKVCPGEDRGPDYVKSYAAWDVACRAGVGDWACSGRYIPVKEGRMTAEQVEEAKRQSAAWREQAREMRERNLAEQRRHREALLPEIRKAIEEWENSF